jgi:hypothetical protein
VTWIDVAIEPEPGAELTLTVHRAAYIDAGVGRSD